MMIIIIITTIIITTIIIFISRKTGPFWQTDNFQTPKGQELKPLQNLGIDIWIYLDILWYIWFATVMMLICHDMPTTIFVTRISTDGLRCGGAVPWHHPVGHVAQGNVTDSRMKGSEMQIPGDTSTIHINTHNIHIIYTYTQYTLFLWLLLTYGS
jgi:hypothetical protein